MGRNQQGLNRDACETNRSGLFDEVGRVCSGKNFFSEVSQNYFILLNNSLHICMLICFMCPIDMIPFHQIQKFIYLFVGEYEIQVK